MRLGETVDLTPPPHSAPCSIIPFTTSQGRRPSRRRERPGPGEPVQLHDPDRDV